MTAHPTRRRPAPPLIAAALAAALVAALGAALFDGVRRGAVVGPSLTLQLGSYALVARTTEHPACLPLPQQCFIPRPTFRIPQPRYYAVWAGQITYPVTKGRQSPLATVRGRQLLRLPLAPAE